MSNKYGHSAVWVVIPAAGVGKRMHSDCPKQYLQLQDKTILEHTLDCFLGHPAIRGIVVVVSAEDGYWPLLEERLQGFPVYRAPGGGERADSVLNGLDFLAALPGVTDADVVLVHDAARPCLPRQDLSLLLAAAQDCAQCGALLAYPVRDTMKRSLPDSTPARVAQTESRDGLWHALTPQLAGLGVLRNALRAALQQGVALTDEASALEWAGLQPRLLEGQAGNIKITRPDDLALADFFLQQRLHEEEA
ncbi:MAG: 2-C-methyl-D-erythritol 4-phosphate cytidylyltransferase [Thiolinea sp.]